MKKVCLCVGTRPNFVKAAPLIRAFKKFDIQYDLIHTSQHYDKNMSQIFFDQLGIPEPDFHLNFWIEEDGPGAQIGRTMCILERQFKIRKPDMIMVVGDVNSTLACALAANKMQLPLSHVEAGERCWDRKLPEEINRILVDEISDHLFAASRQSYKNLIDEDMCCARNRTTYLVGDTMIDQIIFIRSKLDKIPIMHGPYAILTLHRCGNVDYEDKMRSIFSVINKIAEKIDIIFPCHPRTKKRWLEYGFTNSSRKIIFENPMPYFEFMAMVKNARFVITDSGGLQVETSFLNVPCITIRENTERIYTIISGTNILVSPNDINDGKIFKYVNEILSRKWKKTDFDKNPLNDGMAACRIAEVLKEI